MKHKSFILVLGILLVGFFLSCGNEEDNDPVPKLNSVLTSDSEDNLKDGIEKTAFKVGDLVWVGLTTHDFDKNIVLITCIFENLSRKDKEPDIFEFEVALEYVDTYWWASFRITEEDEGTTLMKVFVTDADGNVSNTIEKRLSVTG